MIRCIKCVFALTVCLALVGCEQKSSVTKETTVKGPGGTTQKTEETTVKTTGDNPPPADATLPATQNDPN